MTYNFDKEIEGLTPSERLRIKVEKTIDDQFHEYLYELRTAGKINAEEHGELLYLWIKGKNSRKTI